MVMTTSASRTKASARGFGTSRLMSRPTSFIASTTPGLRVLAGSLPAERTLTRPAPRSLRSAAAIWLRPALWTHTNRTSGMSLLTRCLDHIPKPRLGQNQSHAGEKRGADHQPPPGAGEQRAGGAAGRADWGAIPRSAPGSGHEGRVHPSARAR